MHATIEQLVAIKNGEQNAIGSHMENCSHCQQELAALEELNEQLFLQADQVPSEALWQRIEESVAAEQNHPTGVSLDFLASRQAAVTSTQIGVQNHSLSHAVYTLAASILVTGFIGLYMFSQNMNSSTQSELLQANIQQLMINSQGMEQALAKVSLQSELLTASQRTQADRLYWQLAYLDQMIQDSNVDAETNPERTEVLWNNRIQALRELNQLYYQRQQTLEESEI